MFDATPFLNKPKNMKFFPLKDFSMLMFNKGRKLVNNSNTVQNIHGILIYNNFLPSSPESKYLRQIGQPVNDQASKQTVILRLLLYFHR